MIRIYGIKTTGFLTQLNTINGKRLPPNFNKISWSFSDIFGQKSVSGNAVHIFGIWDLQMYGLILTIFKPDNFKSHPDLNTSDYLDHLYWYILYNSISISLSLKWNKQPLGERNYVTTYVTTCFESIKIYRPTYAWRIYVL